MESSLPNVDSCMYSTAQEELNQIKTKHDLREPNRGPTIEDAGVHWRIRKPDYTLANLAFLKGKTMNHAAGSLEEIVENLVKTWEMEATHKTDFSQWTTVNQDTYCVAANGGEVVPGIDAKKQGNYNWLMDGCREDLWNSKLTDFEKSHHAFSTAFPEGFPWELLQVFAGPPHVMFSWRHWAKYSGVYTDIRGDEHLGDNSTVEMYGLARVTVDANLKIEKIDISYKPDEFLEVLHGVRSAEELARGQSLIGPGSACPFIHSHKN
jgi:hypothetical protein